ncbi:MAG TPA: tetratricopeptide repeat protein [Cyclobacteriaceae bacterium]
MKKSGLAFFLLSLGNMCFVYGQVPLPDSIQSFLKNPIKDSAYITELNRIAFNYLKSSPTIARELAAKAIEASREISFARGYTRALNVTGSSYWVVGEYESALDYYQLSARESGVIKDTLGLANSYNNMGEVYKKIQDYPKSIELQNIALRFQQKIKIPYAIAYYNIGENYLLMNRLPDANDYFNRSLTQSLAENDMRTLAYTYQGLGLIKHKEKEYYQALAYFTKAEKLWKSQGEIRTLIQIYQNFADTFVELKQFDKGKEYVNQALQLATQIQAADLQVSNYHKLANLHQANGEFEKAVIVLQKYGAIKDSIYNLKKTEQIARLQAMFETEEREIENQQLKAEQSEKSEQIRIQQLLLLAISIGLLIAGIMSWVLLRQRKQILEVNSLLKDRSNEIGLQKEEIESQAQKLKNLNNQLQDMNRSLEDRIEERTHLLRKQNEKLAEYAHANAHHLRAPIVSILGLLNLIEKIDLREDDQMLIRHLQKCGQDLDRITRHISKNLEEEESKF